MSEQNGKIKDARGALILAILFAFVATDVTAIGIIAAWVAITTLNPYAALAAIGAFGVSAMGYKMAISTYKDSRNYYVEANGLLAGQEKG